MIVCVSAYTTAGKELARKLRRVLNEDIVLIREDESLAEWTQNVFARRAALISIGATSIAVRAIAPYVKNKKTDPPVLSIDERGRYVIALLSGHLGGANELAKRVARLIGATPIVTTATDLEGRFAVDMFAKNNRMRIDDYSRVTELTAKVLRGEKISVSVDRERIDITANDCPEQLEILDDKTREYVDVRIGVVGEGNCMVEILPKPYVVGVGCRRGTTKEQFERAFQEFFRQRKVCFEIEDASPLASHFFQLCPALATIDLKKDEIGLHEFAQSVGVPLYFYSAEELNCAEGEFSSSEFVLSIAGVDNVCERAALLCAGQGALIEKKFVCDGVTIAVVNCKPEIKRWLN